jgi:arylsulfatase A-like enzyme
MRETLRPGTVLSNAIVIPLIGIWVLSCAGLPKAPESPPNVVLIFVDTLRADHLGVYGYERDTSPAIDRLASESLVFQHAIAQAPWTTPSVASALSSRFPNEIGYEDSRPPAVLADRFLLLPEIFSANGYQTAAIISHFFLSQKLGFAQGFDDFDASNALGHLHISSPSVADKAIQYLDERGKSDPPFFLFLHFFDPHYAYQLHESYDFDPDYQGSIDPGVDQPELQERARGYDDADREHVSALYDSEIRFTDEHLGRLFDALRSRDLYKDTLIVVAGDHGEEFGTRGTPHFGHSSTLFQELIHVPLIIKLPGRSHSQTIETPVGLIDLTPSLIAALSLEVPKDHRFDGRTLPLREPNQLAELPEVPIFSETRIWGLFRQSVTFADRKLIFDHRAGKASFFHLGDDPDEKVDLAEERRPAVNAYLQKLELWNHYVQDRREGSKPPPAADFSSEEMEQLRALGYLD